MNRWQNRVAVVTGASSGIGSEIAKDLVKSGVIVVGLARRKERVDEIRAGLPPKLQQNMHSLKCDVSDLNSVNQVFDWIERNLGGIDILINNAGTLKSGQLVTLDVAHLQQTLQTNVMGVVYCTQRAFKSMKSRNFDGHVVLINSITGHYIFNTPPDVVQSLNIYPPTKHALTGITEILRQEFRGLNTKIKVTSVSPGLVNTEIVPDSFKTFNMLAPEDVSAGVMYVLSTPPHVQVHELTIKPVGELF